MHIVNICNDIEHNENNKLCQKYHLIKLQSASKQSSLSYIIISTERTA